MKNKKKKSMDQTHIERVEAAKLKQAEVADTIRAVKGQDHLDKAVALASVVLLGRALSSIGYVDAATALSESALKNLFTAFGISDESLSLELGKDAVALAEVSHLQSP